MTIRFKRIYQTYRFLDPRKEFAPYEEVLEYRMDPLLMRWCRISGDRARRVEHAKVIGRREKLEDTVEGSVEGCFLCPDKLKSSTPKFHPDLIEEGRIEAGRSIVFPNLYPFSKYHAVCTITEKHYIELSEATADMLENAFQASIDFLKKVYLKDRAARYPHINFNYMPPAGASIIHPHLQILMDSNPTLGLRKIIDASRGYFHREERCYWEELEEREKELGERFIGVCGSTSWISSWAPIGNNEVLGILKKPISSILEVEGEDLASLAEGVSRILRGMGEERGVRSFNLTIYSGPAGEDMGKIFRVLVKIISRPTFRDFYTSDRGFMEILHEEPVIETMPEHVAEDLRRYF